MRPQDLALVEGRVEVGVGDIEKALAKRPLGRRIVLRLDRAEPPDCLRRRSKGLTDQVVRSEPATDEIIHSAKRVCSLTAEDIDPYDLISFCTELSWDNWLHLVHVLAAMVWVGGGIILCTLGLRARSSKNAVAVREFGELLPYVGLRVLMPAVVLVPLTGILMIVGSNEWQFSQSWVVIGIGLFVLAFLIGAVYLSRVGIQMQRAATAEGDDVTAITVFLNRWLVGYGTVLALLLIALWDMVFKPGA
jgi:uncharacterized membrane protein